MTLTKNEEKKLTCALDVLMAMLGFDEECFGGYVVGARDELLQVVNAIAPSPDTPTE